MKKRFALLYILLGLTLTAAAQTRPQPTLLDSLYTLLQKDKSARTDSVRYTGNDPGPSGIFAWQRGEGTGWTTGCRLTLRPATPSLVNRVRACFESLADKQFVNLANPHWAGTYEEDSRTVYLYRNDTARQTLYFLRASTPGEICVPADWPTRDYLCARRHTSYENFSDRQLRQLGAARLWAEVRRNFVFMDRVTVDWDSLYLATLPLVEEARTFGECTRLLQRMAARLGDGHTYVYGDGPATSIAPLTTRYIDGRVYVDQVESRSLAAMGVSRGMELRRIGGLPVLDYGRLYVSPYVSSSTPQWPLHQTFDGHALLNAAPGDTLRLTLASGEREFEVDYVAGQHRRDMAGAPEPTLTLRVLDGNVGYLRIRNFSDGNFREAFDRLYPELLRTDALVIDVRDNGGGNSGNADYVLCHLTADSIRTDAWSSPMYIPAFASWGQKPRWYRQPSQLMAPASDATPYLRPVALLVDRGTFSAAEDFCAVFLGMKRGPLVGTPTGGSTGNGVRVTLIPGHAYANICSKHDVAPDGTEFVGRGIQPTVEVKETPATYFSDAPDAALTEALRLLKTGK